MEETGSRSDRKTVKGVAFTELVEVISLPTHSGRKNGVTNKQLTEIQKALLQVCSYPNSLILG